MYIPQKSFQSNDCGYQLVTRFTHYMIIFVSIYLYLPEECNVPSITTCTISTIIYPLIQAHAQQVAKTSPPLFVVFILLINIQTYLIRSFTRDMNRHSWEEIFPKRCQLAQITTGYRGLVKHNGWVKQNDTCEWLWISINYSSLLAGAVQRSCQLKLHLSWT